MRVEVIAAKAGSSDRAELLPGSVQPLMETVLYARASGFVRRWLVDMGDKVTAGQLLAEIETPELDQELEQARAQLAQAQPTLQRSKASRDLVERQPAALPAAHAGGRRVAGRPRPAAGAGAGRRRERQRRAGHHRRAAGEHPTPHAAQGVLPRDRAVRGHDHAALGRGRRARHGRQRPAALPSRRHRSGARLRAGAAGRGAGPSRRRPRGGHGARVPGPQVRRERSPAPPASSTPRRGR